MTYTSIFAPSGPEPNEQEISDYAFHLYQQSHCEPGHDVDNWRDATACLKADIANAEFAPIEWELLADL